MSTTHNKILIKAETEAQISEAEIAELAAVGVYVDADELQPDDETLQPDDEQLQPEDEQEEQLL